jgi:hypothetical protein
MAQFGTPGCRIVPRSYSRQYDSLPPGCHRLPFHRSFLPDLEAVLKRLTHDRMRPHSSCGCFSIACTARPGQRSPGELDAGDVEPCTALRAVGNLYLPVVGLDDIAHDCQAEAGAIVDRGVAALEHLFAL